MAGELGGATTVAFVTVADRDGGRAFYRDFLGLPLKTEDGFGDTYDLGGTLLRVTALPGYQGVGSPALGFDVADIVATVRALAARGVVFTIYGGFGQDADGIWTGPDGKTRLAWFTDPFGNVLVVSQNA